MGNAPTCSRTGPPYGCCQPSVHACDKSRCMCMIVGIMISRTLGQLGEVWYKAKFCGKLVKLFLLKIRQGTLLVVQKIAVNVQMYAGNALEEMKMSDSSKLEKKD